MNFSPRFLVLFAFWSSFSFGPLLHVRVARRIRMPSRDDSVHSHTETDLHQPRFRVQSESQTLCPGCTDRPSATSKQLSHFNIWSDPLTCQTSGHIAPIFSTKTWIENCWSSPVVGRSIFENSVSATFCTESFIDTDVRHPIARDTFVLESLVDLWMTPVVEKNINDNSPDQ